MAAALGAGVGRNSGLVPPWEVALALVGDCLKTGMEINFNNAQYWYEVLESSQIHLF